MAVNAPLALIYPTLLAVLTQNNYTIFPTDDGVPYLIKLDESPLTIQQQEALASDVNTITFSLYTRGNPGDGSILKLDDVNSVKNSRWNANRRTVVIIHGWKSGGTQPVATLIRNAFLKVLDANVIVVDWSKIASNVNYAQVAKSLPAVANHVEAFLNFLRGKAGLQSSKLTIIGHSLGAHIAGLSARKISQVMAVVALDPAKPMFDSKGAGDRVDKSDAINVQVVHTCAGLLGLESSVGTSDFFANNGRNQPGCSNDLLGSCAHGRAYEYFAESVTNPKGFLGTRRDGGKAYMGGPTLDPNARGTYDFKTGSQPPYALSK